MGQVPEVPVRQTFGECRDPDLNRNAPCGRELDLPAPHNRKLNTAGGVQIRPFLRREGNKASSPFIDSDWKFIADIEEGERSWVNTRPSTVKHDRTRT